MAAAELTDELLALIRDEIGTETPPTDDDLFEAWDSFGDSADVATGWIRVALRVLRRRRATIAGGSRTESFTLTGVLSVSQGASGTGLAALDRQIARLELLLGGDVETALPKVTSSRLHRRHSPWRGRRPVC